MGIEHVTGGESGLKSALSRAGGKLVVVDFFADWCGPCKAIAPHLESLASRNPDVVFLKLNEKDGQDAIEARGVRAFPTFHFYISSKLVHELRGADPNGLSDAVQRLKQQAQSSFGGAGASLGGGAASAQSANPDAVRAARLARLGGPAPATGGPGAAATSGAPAPSTGTAVPTAAPAPALRPAPAAAGAAKPSHTVRQEDLDMLLAMGFPAAKAALALAATGALEAAVDWLERHQDTDVEMTDSTGAGDAAKPAAGDGAAKGTGEAIDMESDEVKEALAAHDASQETGGGPKKKLSAEELNALLLKRRAEKQEIAKREARERELQRREHGKKSLEMAEEIADIQRKQAAEKLKREKEETIRERERLRLELARDKAERLAAKTGKAPEELVKEITAKVVAKETGAPVATVIHDPHAAIKNAVKSMTVFKTGDAGRIAAETLRKLVANVLEHPAEQKYRGVNLSNDAIKARLGLGSVTGPVLLLKACGWSKSPDDEHRLVLADSAKDDALLGAARAELDRALQAGEFN